MRNLGQVGSVTGADTSMGMLEALAAKAAAQETAITPLPLKGTPDEDLGGPYALIVSSMTLHHIADVPALFRNFSRHLRPGGQVALADLDEEDGSFHGPEVSIEHRGFQRGRIRTWLEEAGFVDVRVETATVTSKEGKAYPVFLATGRL